jgi:hypothetical protein
MAISRDAGETWTNRRSLEMNKDGCYFYTATRVGGEARAGWLLGGKRRVG